MPDRTCWTYVVLLLVLVAGMIFLQESSLAQGGAQPKDAKAKAAGAPAETEKSEQSAAGEDDSIMSLIYQSGYMGLLFMAVLGLFSLVAVTVAIDRIMITRRDKIIPAEFVEGLQKLVREKDSPPESFRKLCSRYSAPIASILSAGLLRCGRPVLEVEKSMEDAAAREMASMRGGIRPLSVVGSIAPLVGLLGTVLGMIIAFRTASQAGLGKGELMAQGIYMALLTTAAGLTIAIPALLMSALLNSKVEKSFREIDERLMQAMPCFSRMEVRPAPVSPAAPQTGNQEASGTDKIIWVGSEKL